MWKPKRKKKRHEVYAYDIYKAKPDGFTLCTVRYMESYCVIEEYNTLFPYGLTYDEYSEMMQESHLVSQEQPHDVNLFDFVTAPMLLLNEGDISIIASKLKKYGCIVVKE